MISFLHIKVRMIININSDSISGFIGSSIALTFAIYYLTSNLIVKKERLTLGLSALMFTVSIYLFSYSLYASSTDIGRVLFWTRLCYAAGATAITVGFHLTSEIIEKQSRNLKFFMFALTIILIALIYLPSDLIFKDELNPVKTHSSVIKGPLFPYMLTIIYIADFIVLARFFMGVIQNKDQRYLTVPILYALIFWFAEALVEGVLGAILSIVPMKISLGPIIMTFSLALYSGRYARRGETELVRIKEENLKIYRNLIYDSLSSLYSRKYFIEVLEQRAAIVNREKSHDCLMFLDVDNFKSVNDILGHSYGDDLIRHIGSVLTRGCRKSDICARYGGDEFLILLENCPMEDALKIGKNLQHTLKTGLQDLFGDWSGNENISFSIGVVSSRFWSSDPAEIIRMADMAMYKAKAKASGRNAVVSYSEDLLETTR